MIRTLKVILSKVTDIKEIEVSHIKNKSYGDYSSNVFLKHSLEGHHIISELKKYDLFEEVAMVNGYLNLTLNTRLLKNTVPGQGIKSPARLHEVYKRLSSEGYTSSPMISKEWSPLTKQINLLQNTYETFQQVLTEDVQALFKTFEKIDHGYRYRLCDPSSLSGIRSLLEILIKLERKKDE